jgi:dTDP-4-amino-4,6-dideoxygalactose transaminase
MTLRLFTTGAPQTPDLPALMQKIQAVFERNQLSNHGPEVQQLEAEVSQWLGVKHTIAVANATLGLLLACKALDLSGEILLPSFTFPATAHVLPWLNLRPVFIDVDPFTHNLDPDIVAQHISDRTSAILGVQLWGHLNHVAGLKRVADQANLPLVMDAAHALGCRDAHVTAGVLGTVEVFSLHATKFIHGLEGGLICTQDDGLAEAIRALINFGYHQGVLQYAGLNAKLNEVSATVARHNLQYQASFIAHNQAVYGGYEEQINPIKGLRFYPQEAGSNYQYMVLEVFPEFGMTADTLQQKLQAEGVLSKRYFTPLHSSVPYRDEHGDRALPYTDALSQRTLVLPGGQQMTPAGVAQVGELLRRLSAG